jgi:hypothetical protein
MASFSLCVLIALALGVATWAAFACELHRTKPQLFAPLLGAFLGWLLAAIWLLVSDLTAAPGDWRFEILAPIGATVMSAACGGCFVIALLLSWLTSRNKR